MVNDNHHVIVVADPAELAKMAAQRLGIAVTRLGHFHSGPPEVMVRQANGEPLALKEGGWSHF